MEEKVQLLQPELQEIIDIQLGSVDFNSKENNHKQKKYRRKPLPLSMNLQPKLQPQEKKLMKIYRGDGVRKLEMIHKGNIFTPMPQAQKARPNQPFPLINPTPGVSCAQNQFN